MFIVLAEGQVLLLVQICYQMKLQSEFERLHRLREQDRVENGEGAGAGNAEQDEIQ